MSEEVNTPEPYREVVAVTMVTAEKEYCLVQTLQAMANLDGVSFCLLIDANLDREEMPPIPAGWDQRFVVLPVPSPPEFDSLYRLSLRIAYLREQVRLALLDLKDVAGNPVDGYTHVLWVDADCILPSDTITRLIAHDKPMVTGLVISRDGGHPIVGMERRHDVHPGSDFTVRPGLQPAGWASMGCLLARADLVREISFQDFIDNPDAHFIGEDSFFCYASAALSGADLYLDADVSPWHVDSTGVAIRGFWLGDVLTTEMCIVGTPDQQRACLIPRVSGWSHTLGELKHGRPHRTNAAGEELSVETMKRLAAGSQVLQFLDPLPADL